MSPVASFLFLATPMASVATLAHLKREKRRKSVLPPEAPPVPAPETLEAPEVTSSSEAWRSAIGGFIDEEDHMSVLAAHYRSKPN